MKSGIEQMKDAELLGTIMDTQPMPVNSYPRGDAVHGMNSDEDVYSLRRLCDRFFTVAVATMSLTKAGLSVGMSELEVCAHNQVVRRQSDDSKDGASVFRIFVEARR